MLVKTKEFILWLENQDAHGELAWITPEMAERVFRQNPKISFKKALELITVEKIADELVIGGESIKEIEDHPMSTEETKQTENNSASFEIVPNAEGSRAQQLVARAAAWAEENPTAAVAVATGTTVLAAYGGYKLAQKIF